MTLSHEHTGPQNRSAVQAHPWTDVKHWLHFSLWPIGSVKKSFLATAEPCRNKITKPAGWETGYSIVQ